MEKYISKLGKLYDIDRTDNGLLVVLDHDKSVDPMRDDPCVACVCYTDEDIENGVRKYEEAEGYDRDGGYFIVNGIKFFTRDIEDGTGHSCFGDLAINLNADVFEVFQENEGKSFNTESLKAAIADAEYECYERGFLEEDECEFYKVTELDRIMKAITDWSYKIGAWDTDIFTEGWKEYFHDIDGTIYGMEEQIEDYIQYGDEDKEGEESSYVKEGRKLIERLKAIKG